MGLETLNTTSEIAALQGNIQDEINGVGGNPMDVFQHIKKKSLESKFARLKKISEILEIAKYKIVFIGTIGQGKTTAICHLFNLIGKFERDETINKRVVKLIKTEPLFPTGSGRTTISEVIIKSSENTFIEIEPYSREQLVKFIEEFTDAIYQSNNSDSEPFSFELDRAIRNIIKFKKNQRIKDDTGKERQVDFAKHIAENTAKDDFLEKALSNANLDARKYSIEESRLHYDQSEDERTWLQKNLDNINKGEQGNFSIPKKINVNVSRNVTIDSDIDAFDSVIDTKGIDEIAIRPDLRDYIERDDTICLFTTSYNDAPEANIRELVKYFLAQRSNAYENKFVLLVLARKGEPEQENDGDKTWDTGVTLKRDIVVRVLGDMHITFLDDNILFYDSLKFYDDKFRLQQDYNEEDAQFDKNSTIATIQTIIENKKERLRNEVLEIGVDFQLIKNGKIISEDEIQIINKTSSKIQLYKELSAKIPGFVYDEFIDEYVKYYASHYTAWNTKDAINRRFGTYDIRNIDTYVDAKIVAEGLDEGKMLRKFTNGVKNEILALLASLAEAIPELRSFVNEIETRFKLSYDRFINDVGDEIENYFQEHNENLEFWETMIDRRGKGAGYTNDVLTYLRRNLQDIKTAIPGESVSAERVLETFAEKHWRTVISELLNFFGE